MKCQKKIQEMDDSTLPKRFAPINKRLTQSLSPLSFSSFMTQKKMKQKRLSQQMNQNENYQNEKGTLLNNIFELNKASLSAFFTHHSIAFRLIQELLLFHRPIPFIILLSLLNINLYFYRSFQFTFYSQVVLIVFLNILFRIFFTKVWPIAYETLFLSDAEVQKLKEINYLPKVNEEGKDNNINASSEDISTGEKSNEKKEVDKQEKKIDPRYDPKVLNHLRSPDEVANIVFKLFNPIRVFLKTFAVLSNDNSLEGLEIMFCVYLFFFCFTILFDLFWPIAIFLNVIFILPGIYFNPQIRRLIIGFRKKWKI